MTPPQVIILAGPNGAGKSTAAASLLPEGVTFVNADEIAKTLPKRQGQNVLASRLMRLEMDDLEHGQSSFALETTLASRALAPRLIRLRAQGYQIRLVFFWLPTVELAIQRVADRVRRGGHSVPEETIRRRYQAGLGNFFSLYAEILDSWQFVDNSRELSVRLIAEYRAAQLVVHDTQTWQLLRRQTVDEYT